METKRICSICGKTLAANAPEGLCPECLLKAGLGSGVDIGPDTEAGPARPRFVPPTVAELVPLFPQLEILELIGQGGMGAVYKARQKELERIVALKILPPGIGKDPAFAERFTREARALARLNHPGIVTLYEFGKFDPAPSSPGSQPALYYFLMEFVDGVNLRQLLSASRLAPREALAVVPQICDALQYAHDAGIVHRDIKPENILLDRRGRVKVADFGLAKLVGNGSDSAAGDAAAGLPALTGTGKIMGTPQYMAPEQIEHPANVDHRADIYALGVVFYQMLTGELPGKKIEAPSKKVQIDVRLDEIVLRAMEKNPELRYQQVSEVKSQVETLSASNSTAIPVAAQPEPGESTPRQRFGVLLPLVMLAGVLALLFWRSFIPRYVLFSNDTPLGVRMAEWMRLPSGWLGRWDDLNSLGFNAGSFGESLTTLCIWLLGPLGSSKFLAPVMLCFVGLCAWFLFRRLRLGNFAALLGALGVTLSSSFLSMACWGVTPVVLGIGMSYLAIGLIVSANRTPRALERWASLALAGLAAGTGILEAADDGIIFSFVILAFVVFCSMVEMGPFRAKAARSCLRALVVAGFAFFIAGQTVVGLMNPPGKSGGGVQQDKWDWATQWSLPKTEALSLVVPGLFGYLMNTPDGGNYRGGIGRDPAIDRWIDNGRQGTQPQGVMRFSGGGNYAGLPVVLVALWAALQAFRRKDSVFTLPERQMIWFWGCLCVICLLLAFGRFAPFYQLVHALPYFSGIRNPIRFLNPMVFSVSMLFAYGLSALWRRYMEAPTPAVTANEPGNLWARLGGFDRRWIVGCALALGLSLVVWMLYANSIESHAHKDDALSEIISKLRLEISQTEDELRIAKKSAGIISLPDAERSYQEQASRIHTDLLEARASLAEHRTLAQNGQTNTASLPMKIKELEAQYAEIQADTAKLNEAEAKIADLDRKKKLQEKNYTRFMTQMAESNESQSDSTATFIVHQVGWFFLFFILAAGLLTLILGSIFSGPRARWGAGLLGLLLVLDLGRANLPWIVHWDYQQKYASNDVIEFFRQKPYEHRMAELPFRIKPEWAMLSQLYRIEWAQHHFPYYNIQSLDVVQLPFMPEDLRAFEAALAPRGSNGMFGITRRWQLTNTRYLLGPASFLNLLNRGTNLDEPRFRIVHSFDIVPKPGVTKPAKLEDMTAVFKDGPYAIFEFTGALPRAKLYSHWQVNTNDQAVLEQLGNADFDPEKTVFVDSDLRGNQAMESAGPDAADGEVEFADYASKRIVLKTKAEVASVLLLNDKFDPAWQVTVDGEPASLLRCNYIMRGVQLTPGVHTVEFTFNLSLGLPFARVQVERDTQLVEFIFKVPIGLPSYITLAAFGVGLVLIGVLVVAGRRKGI